ncbi:MAG TPA: type II toxin-antitoxin system PemK/MazF family toxin [Burkholderiaceae bacterium]|nr:type II toxin-antitoxin system PemK/MazF family toxin [Burkholderiaceae bacterium]
MSKRYTPEAGDIIHVHFAVPSRHAGPDYKPALVISPSLYNRKSGLMVCCAITEAPKGYPFEVELAGVPGYSALADQVKSLGWPGIKISHQGRANPEELAAVRAKLTALLLPG